MWYAVSLLYKSFHLPPESEPTLWEESVRLIQAPTEAEARAAAERIGRSGAHSYEVESGTVSWTFEGIERVYLIEDEELRNGSEVFSRFLRDAEVKSLLTPFSDETP
jgi:hypothetical protein